MTIDTMNRHLVGMGGASGELCVLRPIHGDITREHALSLCAWLIVLGDLEDELPAWIAAVKAT